MKTMSHGPNGGPGFCSYDLNKDSFGQSYWMYFPAVYPEDNVRIEWKGIENVYHSHDEDLEKTILLSLNIDKVVLSSTFSSNSTTVKENFLSLKKCKR